MDQSGMDTKKKSWIKPLLIVLDGKETYGGTDDWAREDEVACPTCGS